ncbi:hypothetical protein ACP275_10G126100 [Erythranthe tilingii]
MGDKYAECHKSHENLGGKSDGCQEFMKGYLSSNCGNCGCHRNFHRKVVYTKCRKVHDFKTPNSVDGCQEFIPRGNMGSLDELICDVCLCNKGFHEKG